MNQIKEPVKFILALYFGLITAIGFFLLYPAFLYTLSNPKRYNWGHKLRKIWGSWLFIAGAIRVRHVEETEFEKKHTAYVIVPNHTSMLDIVTLTVKLHLNFNFMAKIELTKVPLFGIFFRTIDIAVDRKNARHAANSFQRAVNQLTQQKKSIVIFPEGTIPAHTPKLGKFKDGPFKLAIDTQTPLLPITIIKNWEILPDQGKIRFKPGTVYQYVHAPIDTKGLTAEHIPMLKEQVSHMMKHKLAEYGYQ